LLAIPNWDVVEGTEEGEGDEEAEEEDAKEEEEKEEEEEEEEEEDPGEPGFKASGAIVLIELPTLMPLPLSPLPLPLPPPPPPPPPQLPLLCHDVIPLCRLSLPPFARCFLARIRAAAPRGLADVVVPTDAKEEEEEGTEEEEEDEVDAPLFPPSCVITSPVPSLL